MKESNLKKHKEIVNNYKDIKSKHLDSLASKMLRQDAKIQNLKKQYDDSFLIERMSANQAQGGQQ